MIDWASITEEDMRRTVLHDLARARDEMTRQAERNERDAADSSKFYRERRESGECARYSRRHAAHYQQAIELLKAAPVPATDEPRCVATDLAVGERVTHVQAPEARGTVTDVGTSRVSVLVLWDGAAEPGFEWAKNVTRAEPS